MPVDEPPDIIPVMYLIYNQCCKQCCNFYLLLLYAPYFHSPVLRARYNGPSVWAERHTAYKVAVALESLETLSTTGRPQFQSVVS